MAMIDSQAGHEQEGRHGDAVSYLLGALEPAARARFETHAAGCDMCRQELSVLQPVVDDLALAAPQIEPPPQLRRRLLTRASIATVDPVTTDAPPTQPVPLQPPPLAALPPRAWWHGTERYSSAVAAASLLVALASGGYAFAARQQLTTTAEAADYATAQLSETLYIVSQPNLLTRSLSGSDGSPSAKGKILLSPDKNKAVVMASDLPTLKNNETFQCWLTNQDERRIDGGVFRSDVSGKAYWVLKLPETLARYRTLGVTREPGKGSPTPSGPRILGGQL